MGLMDAYAAQADTGAQNPLQALPRTAEERFGAEFDAATAPDRWFKLDASRRDWYQRTIDELHDETGKTYLNPLESHVSTEEVAKYGNQTAARSARLNDLIDANRALREVKPDAINAEGIDTFIGVEGEAARQKAASYVDTGNGWAAFLGGMVAPTPENVAGFLIPPSKVMLGATTVGRSFLAGLGRETLYQGAAMGGLTAATEGLDVLSRQQTGTAPTTGEVLGNIAEGAAGGAIFGGAFHALHVGPKALWDRWNGLHPDVRDNAPQQVKDSFQVLEREALYGDTNRFGIPWDVHDQMQTDTLRSVLTGSPVRPIPTTDTAMTALGTILRDVPERMDVSGLQGVLARTTGMADSDLEDIVRQLKPQSFASLDAANAKLRELDDRIEAIHQERQQIGVNDVIDMPTAQILNDIDQRLQQTPLRRAVREDLLRQKQQWLETLDVHGGLTDELQRMRNEFFPEHGPALQQIAAERQGVMRERDLGQQEAQREIDFLKGKLDKIKTAPEPEAKAALTEMGPTPDLAQALQAAEFNRHARVLRENLPTQKPSAPPPVSVRAAPVSGAPVAAQPAVDVSGMLKGKSAADVRKTLTAELEQHEIGVKDAEAIKACVGGTP